MWQVKGAIFSNKDTVASYRVTNVDGHSNKSHSVNYWGALNIENKDDFFMREFNGLVQKATAAVSWIVFAWLGLWAGFAIAGPVIEAPSGKKAEEATAIQIDSPLKLVMPPSRSGLDVRDEYPVRLLKAALDDANIAYSITHSDRQMPQSQVIRQVISGNGINLMWSMTSVQREEELLPIRIPLFRGLIGWRIFLIHKDNQALFDGLKTEKALRSLVAVQGLDWPDLIILRASGFRTTSLTEYDAMFDAVENKRVHYFPRSVREVWGELELRKDQDLKVETEWAVHYPTAAYFFVSRDNKALAATIENALLRTVANGKFEQMFMEEHKQYLDRANFAKRKIIHIDNPLLPPETPVLEEEFWYH